MSVDLIYLSAVASNVVGIIIMLVGVYRALEMRKGFVDPTYKSRALWSMALMLAIVLGDITSVLPTSNDVLGTVVGLTPFIAIILVSFAFIDRTILVTSRTDFFHRDTLRWTRVRSPATVALFAASAVMYIASLAFPQGFAFAFQPVEAGFVEAAYAQFILITTTVLGLGGVAAVIGSRRTPDLTLKKSIRLIAYALLFFVLTIIVSSSVIFGDAGSLLGDIFGVVATYLVYLSVMSLSPLGRVEKEA